MTTWLPLLAALAGTALGGAIASWNGSVQWRRQKETERNRVLLGKLEEACKTVIAVQLGLKRSYGEATMQAVTDLLPALDGSAERVPFEELDMLVSMYFRHLGPQYEAVVAARDELGRLTTALVLSRNIDKTRAKPTVEQLSAVYKKVEAACQAFLQEASLLSAKYL